MQVRLISYTQPVKQRIDGDKISLLDQIAYAARVSNPANQNNEATSDKLVRYLIANNHWSPLEMVSATVEIETTRDIARQILRHRSFSFQEFSQRYADASQLGFEYRECRLQDVKNRQNSIAGADQELSRAWADKQIAVKMLVEEAYMWALNNGIAKEQARAVLPEGMTMSRMYMAGTLRSWWHYIALRSGHGTQKEHKEIAVACAYSLQDIFPMITEAVCS